VRFRPKADAASPGFLSPSAHQAAGSDYPGFASPGYAASPGFPTPLTPCSSHRPPAIFQTGNAPGVVPFEGFPFRGTVSHLSVRPARLAFAQSGPSAHRRRGSSRVYRAFPSAEVRCLHDVVGAATARASPGLSSPPGVDLSARRPRSSRMPPPGASRKVGGRAACPRCPSECRSPGALETSSEASAPPGVLAPRVEPLSGPGCRCRSALRRVPLPWHGLSPLGQTSPPGVRSIGSVRPSAARILARLPGFSLRGSPLPSRRG